MKFLPYGSTIYFAKNGKCSQDYSTPLFCLVNQTLYKVEESNHFFILNISDYNQSYYYELNILNNSNSKDTTCIISYIKNSSNIMFLHFLIEGQNYSKLIKEYSLKIIKTLTAKNIMIKAYAAIILKKIMKLRELIL